MTVPYTFGNESSPIPLSQLDANFATTPAYANTAGNVINSNQANITSVGTLSSLTVSGQSYLNGTVNTNGILPFGNANANIGSSSNQFNTIFAKATSAQYADLAEKYTADAEYAPGTVLAFGGDAEVTASGVFADIIRASKF
mgnify:CR=1 FL=1